MTLNEKLAEQIQKIVDKLESYELPVFEDDIAEDEEKEMLEAGPFECFIYGTGGMAMKDDNRTISQSVTVFYLSENRDDLDERMLNILTDVSSIGGVTFNTSRKVRLRKKDTDRYIDRIEFDFTRTFKKELNC